MANENHIVSATDLNRFAEVDNLDNAKLLFRFGKLSDDQRELKDAVRQFVRECAVELRLETNSRNEKLVQRIITRHNRLLQVLTSRSDFLDSVVDKIGNEVSKTRTVDKDTLEIVKKQVQTAVQSLAKQQSQSNVAGSGYVDEAYSILTNQTIVGEFSSRLRSKLNLYYKKELATDRAIVSRFSTLPKRLIGVSHQLRNIQDQTRRIYKATTASATRIIRGSTVPKHWLVQYNGVALKRAVDVYRRLRNHTPTQAGWFKRSFTHFNKKIRSIVNRMKFATTQFFGYMFSVKGLLKLGGGILTIGKTIGRMVLVPIKLTAHLLTGAFRGVVGFGSALLKSARGITSKILKKLRGSLLKKIFQFLFTPPGAFVAGYLYAFFKDRLGSFFGSFPKKIKEYADRVKGVLNKIKVHIAGGLLKVVKAIANNKIVVAFLSGDGATIAEFLADLQSQFRNKFRDVLDFFRGITGQIVAQAVGGICSALGAAIGSAICPGIGTVIGSIAGGFIATGIGKLFGKAVFDIPETDVSAAQSLKPVYNKYGTATKSATYQHSGLVGMVKSRIDAYGERMHQHMLDIQKGNKKWDEEVAKDYQEQSRLERLHKMVSRYSSIDQGDRKVSFRGGIQHLRDDDERVDGEIDHGTDEITIDTFYDNVESLIEYVRAQAARNPMLVNLPYDGYEFGYLVSKRFDPEESVRTYSSTDEFEKKLANEDRHRTLWLFNYVLLNALNTAYYTGFRMHMTPQDFFDLYNSIVDSTLQQDISDKVRDDILDDWYTNSKVRKNVIQNGKITLERYLTCPLLSERGGNGLFVFSNDKVGKKTKDSIMEAVHKASDMKEIAKVFPQSSHDQYAAIMEFMQTRGVNMLKGLINEETNGNEESKRYLYEEVGIEAFFQKYLFLNLFKYATIKDGKVEWKDQFLGASNFWEEFRQFVQDILNSEGLKDIENKKKERAHKVSEGLAKLIQTLEAVQATGDQQLALGAGQIQQKLMEDESQEDLKNDLDYQDDCRRLKELQDELDRLEKEEGELAKQGSEDSQLLRPVVQLVEEEKQPSLLEEETASTPLFMGSQSLQGIKLWQ